MSTLTPREQMERDLDRLLLEEHRRDQLVRDAEREKRRLEQARSEVGVEVQRTRMALFALDGEHTKNLGDANVANRERLRELLNPATDDENRRDNPPVPVEEDNRG